MSIRNVGVIGYGRFDGGITRGYPGMGFLHIESDFKADSLLHASIDFSMSSNQEKSRIIISPAKCNELVSFIRATNRRFAIHGNNTISRVIISGNQGTKPGKGFYPQT